MMTIFGSGMATGKYAMGSNEPLGSQTELTDTSIKIELFGDDATTKVETEVGKAQGEGSVSASDRKRKRSMLSDAETILLTNMT